jgi:hypothetical protein
MRAVRLQNMHKMDGAQVLIVSTPEMGLMLLSGLRTLVRRVPREEPYLQAFGIGASPKLLCSAQFVC